MAGVFAAFKCLFGHKWRWDGRYFDDCVRCGASRTHIPGTPRF